MERAEVRQARETIRRVENHLRQSHVNMGAIEESIGMVDVIHHPYTHLATVNYVTPRRKTAWVSNSYIEQGIDYLREQGRRVRVRFADGLFPPIFARSLRDLDLTLETETSLMVYRKVQDHLDITLPPDVQFSFVTNHESMAIWWYVWRNAFYNVAVSNVEPVYIGQAMRDVYLGHQINIIMYKNRFPIGVSRVTLHEGTAHIAAHAIMQEFYRPEWDKTLRLVAMDAALTEGCDLIFVSGSDDMTRTRYRELGFIDSGSIVCYADTKAEIEDVLHDTMAQSVLII